MDKYKLLQELKDRLFITWDDPTIDNKLNSIIEDSKIIMDHKLGADINYSAPGLEHSLFLKYCMYEYNNCTNEFDRNYINEIYQIRLKYEVEQFVGDAYEE